MLREILAAILPTTGLVNTLTHWSEIVKRLADSKRTRNAIFPLSKRLWGSTPRPLRTSLRYLLSVLSWQGVGQDHSASTQCQTSNPLSTARIVQLGCDARNVKQQEEQKNDRSQESSRQSRRFS